MTMVALVGAALVLLALAATTLEAPATAAGFLAGACWLLGHCG